MINLKTLLLNENYPHQQKKRDFLSFRNRKVTPWIGFNWFPTCASPTLKPLWHPFLSARWDLSFLDPSQVSLSRDFSKSTCGRQQKKCSTTTVFRWLTSIHVQWGRKTFHFIFPSRSSLKAKKNWEKRRVLSWCA